MNHNHNNIKNHSLCFILILLALSPVVADDFTPPGESGDDSILLGESSATTDFIIADVSGWNLNPIYGVNTHTRVLNVKSDGNWELSVKDPDALNTNGHMTEWDGGGYVASNRLASPLSVSVQFGETVSNAYEVTLPTGGVIARGTGTGSSGMDLVVIFKQPVAWTDKATPGSHNYRMKIEFTLSPS